MEVQLASLVPRAARSSPRRSHRPVVAPSEVELEVQLPLQPGEVQPPAGGPGEARLGRRVVPGFQRQEGHPLLGPAGQQAQAAGPLEAGLGLFQSAAAQGAHPATDLDEGVEKGQREEEGRQRQEREQQPPGQPPAVTPAHIPRPIVALRPPPPSIPLPAQTHHGSSNLPLEQARIFAARTAGGGTR